MIDQTKQMPSEEINDLDAPPRTSIGFKLTLISVGLLMVAFITFSILSIRIGQDTLVTTVEDDLKIKTVETNELIRKKLSEAETIATNLATAVESSSYSENELKRVIQNTVIRNVQIYGATAGFEPYQFKSSSYYWAPYYNRTPNNETQLTELGDYDYFSQEWYFLPKRTLEPTLSPPYRNKSRGDVWIATWSIPFLDRNNKLKGVAAVDIEFSKIQDIFLKSKIWAKRICISNRFKWHNPWHGRRGRRIRTNDRFDVRSCQYRCFKRLAGIGQQNDRWRDRLRRSFG
ncbi:MAG: PDC sensor domain-containing protein [Anaerolineales bacterium]|nr:PDC sensor domain-containing protein [Anaerolineales bacterium]